MQFHIEILWQDEHLLAVNKPAGLRSIPDGYNPSIPHLHGLLNEKVGPVWVIHRLDKDTSGIILFARTSEAHRLMNALFQQREVKKEYHALVTGSPEWDETQINLPLRADGDRKHRTVVDQQHGKPAETTCRVLDRFGDLTMVAAFPHTGYTHQIRAHLAAVGLPVVADPLYKSLLPEDRNKPQPQVSIQRTALHAFRITFTHPITGQEINVQAPYADDFQKLIEELRSFF